MSNVKIWYYHQCAQHPEPTPLWISYLCPEKNNNNNWSKELE